MDFQQQLDFLKKLLRNWKYFSLNNNKQTVMLLNEKSYGPINTSLLKYYEYKN